MNTTTREELTNEEAAVYKFCIEMGDSHKLALQAVEIERRKSKGKEFYRFAYED